MGSLPQAQTNTYIIQDESATQDAPIWRSLHLGPPVWMWIVAAFNWTDQQARCICENLLLNHARNQPEERQVNQRGTVQKSGPSKTSARDRTWTPTQVYRTLSAEYQQKSQQTCTCFTNTKSTPSQNLEHRDTRSLNRFPTIWSATWGLLSVWKKLSDTPRTSRIGSFLLPRLTSPSDDDNDDEYNKRISQQCIYELTKTCFHAKSFHSKTTKNCKIGKKA